MDVFLDFLAAHAGLIGLLFFFVFFVLMTAWTFRPGAKGYYKVNACIPLHEKDNDSER